MIPHSPNVLGGQLTLKKTRRDGFFKLWAAVWKSSLRRICQSKDVIGCPNAYLTEWHLGFSCFQISCVVTFFFRGKNSLKSIPRWNFEHVFSILTFDRCRRATSRHLAKEQISFDMSAKLNSEKYFDDELCLPYCGMSPLGKRSRDRFGQSIPLISI